MLPLPEMKLMQSWTWAGFSACLFRLLNPSGLPMCVIDQIENTRDEAPESLSTYVHRTRRRSPRRRCD